MVRHMKKESIGNTIKLVKIILSIKCTQDNFILGITWVAAIAWNDCWATKKREEPKVIRLKCTC